MASLLAIRAANPAPDLTEFDRARAALDAAVDAAVECAREGGLAVTAELAPNGIVYEFGVSFPGFGTKEEAETATAGADRAIAACQAEHGVAAATQVVMSMAAPSRSELRPVAVACAEAAGQTVPSSATPDEAIAVVAATPDGAWCFRFEVEEMTRNRAAELSGG